MLFPLCKIALSSGRILWPRFAKKEMLWRQLPQHRSVNERPTQPKSFRLKIVFQHSKPVWSKRAIRFSLPLHRASPSLRGRVLRLEGFKPLMPIMKRRLRPWEQTLTLHVQHIRMHPVRPLTLLFRSRRLSMKWLISAPKLSQMLSIWQKKIRVPRTMHYWSTRRTWKLYWQNAKMCYGEKRKRSENCEEGEVSAPGVAQSYRVGARAEVVAQAPSERRCWEWAAKGLGAVCDMVQRAPE